MGHLALCLRSGCCGCPTRERALVFPVARGERARGRTCVTRGDVPVRQCECVYTTQKLRHGFLLRVTAFALVLPLRPWWASGFSSLWGMSSGGGPDSAMKRYRLVYVTTSY